jgi:hypothetical protein
MSAGFQAARSNSSTTNKRLAQTDPNSFVLFTHTFPTTPQEKMYPQGNAPQGYAPQGYAPQGYAPQGYPQGYAPQGYAPQGYAPQGYAPQGYAPPQAAQAQPQGTPFRLDLTIVKASKLPKMDTFGKIDAYVKVKCAGFEEKTDVIKKVHA